jgi:hypothetical protein
MLERNRAPRGWTLTHILANRIVEAKRTALDQPQRRDGSQRLRERSNAEAVVGSVRDGEIGIAKSVRPVEANLLSAAIVITPLKSQTVG